MINHKVTYQHKDMSIPASITVPKYPRFLFAPDQQTLDLYIVCTSPMALIWVRQTTPAQLYIVEGPQDEQMLRDAGEWWRENAVKNMEGD